MICLLPQRGILRLNGDDRSAFLQGLISNDMALCQVGRPLYAAFLTPQGKFLHDLFVVNQGDHFLIDCEGHRADELLKRLMQYKLRAKITLENVSAHYSVWALWGQDIVPPLSDVFVDPRLPALGMRLISPKDYAPPVTPVPSAGHDEHRLQLGVPDGSRDMMIEKSTLLECNLDRLNAISWTKGCYMGQELTARMHYRALLKKRLYPVKFEGPPPAENSYIVYENEAIGEMRSSQKNIGLALLNIEKAELAIQNKTPLQCNGASLIPYKPEWMV